MSRRRFAPGARRGFALLAVLWIVTGVTAVAMVATLAARDAVDVARNRGALAAARWTAVGCLERARSLAEGALKARTYTAPGEGAWATLDTLVRGTAAECTVRIRAVGDAVDVNAIDGDGLLHALVATGVDSARAESLRDALLDWRDADTIARPMGVERSWYVAAGRTPPRDAPLLARAELAMVRGWEDSTPAASFDVETGRAVLSRAPLPVLASLPGFTPQAAGQVLEARARGVRLADVAGLAYSLAPVERAAVAARVPELAARITPEPDAWIVSATAGALATATVEERWARSGTRVAVVRHGVVR